MKLRTIYLASFFLAISAFAVNAQKIARPVDLVYPQLDSENSRWIFFASACRPFGMVNLSPDNKADTDWGSGYRYEKDSVKFFSHIHGWQLSGVPVMPVNGEFKGHLGSKVYGSKYSHDKETVKPGFHSVFLESYGIKAELTSTTRVGFHRYQFPQAPESYILLDLGTLLGPQRNSKRASKKSKRPRNSGLRADGQNQPSSKSNIGLFHHSVRHPL
jgi:putative alpha-1,2-mannosidase